MLDLIGLTSGAAVANYSPDGKLIATSSADGIARIWSARSGELLRTIKLPPGPFQVRFGSEGSSLLTVAGWNIQTWDACSACEDPAALLALARTRVTRPITPDERRLYRG